MKLRTKMISVAALIVIAAFVIPTTPNLAYPNKVQDCSRCHGPSSGTYFEDIMSITVSKTTLSPGENYVVGIDIVIQTSLSKKETGYAIEDLGTGSFVVYLDSTLVQSHFDQTMTAPSSAGTYPYRVWGESGPATSDGKTDYDDFTITVAAPSNGPPTLTPLSNIQVNAGASRSYSASATDPDGDSLRYTWDFGDGSALVVGNPASHTYAKAGTYTYRVYADDLHAHNVTSSATASVAFNLNLVVGWNLISLPMTTTYKASTLGLGSGDQVVQWDPATTTYKTYIVGLPLNDFNIAPSTGYWIYAASAKTLALYGTVPTVQQTKAITVPAGGGWALVGLNSLNTAWKASNLAAMYSGSTMTTVVMWNAATQSYTTYIVGLPLSNFSLVPGQGYWVYVNGSGTLTYAP